MTAWERKKAKRKKAKKKAKRKQAASDLITFVEDVLEAVKRADYRSSIERLPKALRKMDHNVKIGNRKGRWAQRNKAWLFSIVDKLKEPDAQAPNSLEMANWPKIGRPKGVKFEPLGRTKRKELGLPLVASRKKRSQAAEKFQKNWKQALAKLDTSENDTVPHDSDNDTVPHDTV